MKENDSADNIKLSLPINAAYVTAARLTASTIAYRLGFTIDFIEDIKTAVSEACNLIIKKSEVLEKNFFTIVFVTEPDSLKINFTLNDPIDISKSETEMSLMMLKALVDELVIIHDYSNVSSISMTKYIEEKLLEKLEV